MKAAVIESPNNLLITDVPDPECGPDEVILKVHSSSICNATDVGIWNGTFPKEACPPYPHVLGHECSGEIVEIGKDITDWQIGDRVGYWVKMSGAFGQYNAVKVDKLASAKLSDEISDDEAPVMEIVCGTLRCMYDNGMKLGDRVLVFGQGPTGLLLTQEAKLFGAGFICTIDLFENRLAKSIDFGADLKFNLTGKSYDQAHEELMDLVGKVDFIIDAMGNHRWKGGNAINLGLSLMRRGGIYQIWGHPTENQSMNTRWISNENYTIKGFEPGWEVSRRLMQYGDKLVVSGRLDIKSIITHRLPLEKLEEGLILCRDHLDKTIKVVININ